MAELGEIIVECGVCRAVRVDGEWIKKGSALYSAHEDEIIQARKEMRVSTTYCTKCYGDALKEPGENGNSN